MEKLGIPILFLIFNRFEPSSIVFKSIQKQKPEKLYIAADGPRIHKQGEKEQCDLIRKWVLNNIDWDCEVKTLFRNSNLGCGKAVSEAITWFFEQVEEGIILEDDCLPNSTFFEFCAENLKKYRFNNQISIISGNNFQPDQPMHIRTDYYFSIFPSTWGWASWRRVWKNYDLDMQEWHSIDHNNFLNFLFKEKIYKSYWEQTFNNYFLGKGANTWDFQFHFHCMKNRQLAIIPKANLVTNIGFGKMATHTTGKDSYFSNMPTYELTSPLKHPKKIERNYEADVFVQKTLFGEAEIKTSIKRLKHYIKQIIPFKL